MNTHRLRGPVALIAALALAALPVTGAMAQTTSEPTDPSTAAETPSAAATPTDATEDPTADPTPEPSVTDSGAPTEDPTITESPTATSEPSETATASPSATPTSTAAPSETASPTPTPDGPDVHPEIDLGGVTETGPGNLPITIGGIVYGGEFTVELLPQAGQSMTEPPPIVVGTADAEGNATMDFVIGDFRQDGPYRLQVTDLTTGITGVSNVFELKHEGNISLNMNKFNWGDTMIAQITGLVPGSTFDFEVRHPITGKGTSMTGLVAGNDGTSAVTIGISREDFAADPSRDAAVAYGDFDIFVTNAEGTIVAVSSATIQSEGGATPAPSPTLTTPEMAVPGESVNVGLSGFDAGQTYELQLVHPDGSAIDGNIYNGITATVDASGAGSGALPVPWVIQQGKYKVIALDANKKIVAESNTIQVRYPVELSTDKSTYNYGDPFTLTATGFAPGETVRALLGVPYSDGVIWIQEGLKADANGTVVYSSTIQFNQGFQYRVQDKKEFQDFVFVVENPDKSAFGVAPVSVQVAGPALPGSDTSVQGGGTLPETGASLNGPVLGVGTALLLAGVAVFLISRRTPRHG